jgi:seryl-tRNA synthetase
VINRAFMEKNNYLEAFPQLAGLIYSFEGDDAEHRRFADMVRDGDDWSAVPKLTQVALTPAACHPLYPTCTGQLPEQGRLFDLTSYCFRHEPSADPARMQMFRMREHVRMGKPDEVKDWRDTWMERGLSLLRVLGLPAYVAPANDPFFGRTGRMLAQNQLEQELKFEIVLPITSEEKPTAIMSFNYHQDHFAVPYEITTCDGAVAHSACLGFGLERIVIGLFKTHGFDPQKWPLTVRNALWP